MGRKKEIRSDVKAELTALRRRIRSLEAQIRTLKREQIGQRSDEMDGHEIRDALMNALEDHVAVLNKKGFFLQVNQAIGRRFGAPPESLIGQSAWGYVKGETGKLRRAELAIVFKTGQGRRFEDERAGRYFDHIAYPVKGRDGKISKVVVIGRDITRQKSTEKDLRESEERYRLVTERTSDLVSLTTFAARPCYVYVNPSYHAILGYEPKELIGRSPFDFMHPEDREGLTPVLGKYLNASSRDLVITGGKGATERMLYRLKDAFGNWRYMEGTADLLGAQYILVIARDVSERIKTERELECLRKELERQVEERTNELKMKSESLEATNTALRVLLEMRERDRKELEQAVLFNVRQLAEPYLEKLKNSSLDHKQKEHLDILTSSLKEIIIPLSRQFVGTELNLTPSESRIANLIKFGKTSKEIAEILSLSIRTIETHRRKLRRKLGLKENKINLQSYLMEHSNP